jgi:hypothetical protein
MRCAVLCCDVDDDIDIAIVIAVGGEEKALVTREDKTYGTVGVDRERSWIASNVKDHRNPEL